MSLDPEIRAAVRAAYQGRCGYCGVSETWVGSELELDHFRPVAQGGSDALDNLVYACATCHRFKSDYWPPANAPESFRLLHPRQDELRVHLLEVDLQGLTQRGWFHLQRLHLNRPQLIELRQLLQAAQPLQQAWLQAQAVRVKLQARIQELEVETAALQQLMAQLTELPSPPPTSNPLR